MDQSEKIDLIFETSWEVCNKVGGIYTVLSTKAQTLQKLYKDRVVFIGPDVWTDENPSPWFVESDGVMAAWRRKAHLPEGVSVRTGRWLVPGRPMVILVKFDGMFAQKDYFYSKMWEIFGVDSLHAYGDYDEACAFSLAAAAVIESIVTLRRSTNRVVAHFDEWTTGMGLLYTRWRMPRISTVFTTHATCMGRSISGNGKPLYDYLSGYNGDQMATELNMESKHSLEKAAAHAADCFTTVSDVTARECAQLLEATPRVTPNGFENDFVPKPWRMVKERKSARESLLKVASALTGQQFPDDTYIVATSGRCEFRNKGIDVFLDAMKRLAEKRTPKKVLAFVMVPAWVKEPRVELAEALASGNFDGLPDPLITHALNNPNDDAVICRMRQLGFANAKDADTTVIYVPCYLNGSDGIFNRSYYDLLSGFDVTVFPSYYEPWGYTPLESIAFGVPTITTSLSGFGQWVLNDFPNDMKETGVKVITRNDSNAWHVADEIAAAILPLIEANASTRRAIGQAAARTASFAAWDNFVTHYIDAYAEALENADNRQAPTRKADK